MALPIENYAMIGDLHSVALVGSDGSIDWLCLPRFDSSTVFCALLGTRDNGRWKISPSSEVLTTSRCYIGTSLVLESHFQTAEGIVRVVDFMPPREKHPTVVRIVEGVEGRVEMEMDLVIRFDYGRSIPWVRRVGEDLVAVAGPNGLTLRTPARLRGKDFATKSNFVVAKGEMVPFILSSYFPFEALPKPKDSLEALDATLRYWSGWRRRCKEDFAEYEPIVLRSLVTLKGLTYAPTGGITAAATTSLPEEIGGVRNWDYRYCWLRDSALSISALVLEGYSTEIESWSEWLLRAVAGDPSQLQIMYGVAGERRIDEFELDYLSGYEGSRPVRIGNAASTQFQLDVYGEVLDALAGLRSRGLESDLDAWSLQCKLADFVAANWSRPDEGIWEVRGPRRHFVHSKVMAWVALDRAISGVLAHGLPGEIEDWTKARDEIFDQVLSEGYDSDLGAFTQYYGSHSLDASVLLIPTYGFLPASDPRVESTVDVIAERLTVDGLVLRYQTDGSNVDGLPGGEGAFLACSFWLVDAYALMGRVEEAERLYNRLLTLSNDLGLFAEELDFRAGRMLGNFPQAFTHVGVINSARKILEARRRRG